MISLIKELKELYSEIKSYLIRLEYTNIYIYLCVLLLSYLSLKNENLYLINNFNIIINYLFNFIFYFTFYYIIFSIILYSLHLFRKNLYKDKNLILIDWKNFWLEKNIINLIDLWNNKLNITNNKFIIWNLLFSYKQEDIDYYINKYSINSIIFISYNEKYSIKIYVHPNKLEATDAYYIKKIFDENRIITNSADIFFLIFLLFSLFNSAEIFKNKKSEINFIQYSLTAYKNILWTNIIMFLLFLYLFFTKSISFWKIDIINISKRNNNFLYSDNSYIKILINLYNQLSVFINILYNEKDKKIDSSYSLIPWLLFLLNFLIYTISENNYIDNTIDNYTKITYFLPNIYILDIYIWYNILLYDWIFIDKIKSSLKNIDLSFYKTWNFLSKRSNLIQWILYCIITKDEEYFNFLKKNILTLDFEINNWPFLNYKLKDYNKLFDLFEKYL